MEKKLYCSPSASGSPVIGRVQHWLPEEHWLRGEGASVVARWLLAPRQHADIRVSPEGENSREANGLYERVRQDGAYRVAGFRGGEWRPK